MAGDYHGKVITLAQYIKVLIIKFKKIIKMYGTLEKLLDSHPRAKLLKLFYRNVDDLFSFEDIVKRTQSKPKDARSEIRRLEKIKMLRSRKKKGKIYYHVDKESHNYQFMKKFISEVGTIPMDELKKLVENLGSVKLAIATGIFLHLNNSRADLMIVGEDITKAKLSNFLNRAEAETGKEIDFVLMDTEEYRYRRGMYDRFVLDIEEKPHEVLIDKITGRKADIR